jgi:hypothetical protein
LIERESEHHHRGSLLCLKLIMENFLMFLIEDLTASVKGEIVGFKRVTEAVNLQSV